MTVEYGVRGVSYDGTDCQPADESFFLQIVVGLDEVPQVRGSDTIVPGLPGEIPRNRVRSYLDIELAGWVWPKGTDEADRMDAYRTTIAAIQALFDPTARGDLVIALEGGGSLTTEARPLTIIYGEEQVPGLRAISVAMRSPSGLWTG